MRVFGINIGRKPTVAILGATGMLGSMVTKYFSDKGYPLILYARDPIKVMALGGWACRQTIYPADFMRGEAWYKESNEFVDLVEADYCINAIGIIKPTLQSDIQARIINSDLITYLGRIRSRPTIHASTDCVYSGKEGNYKESHWLDAEDAYGKSKANGDFNIKLYNVMSIRASIVGEERYNQYSLLEWVRKQNGNKIQGWINHYWNGITTLQWAKIAELCIRNCWYQKGVRHFHSDRVDKYTLVQTIRDIYDISCDITPCEGPFFCDRTLATEYPEYHAKFKIPSIQKQIEEAKGILV